MPTLVFGLSRTGPITFGETASLQRAIPQKMADKEERRDTPKRPEKDTAEAEDPPGLSATAELTTSAPSETERPLSSPAQQEDAQEDRDDLLPTEEADLALHSAAGLENSSTLGPVSHAIELTIDSLPNRELIQAIPVTVNPLGERLFTATVEALRLSGTGDTLTDALITVKEQIEHMYEKLTKITGLDEMEKDHLRYLHSHIKPTEESPKHKRGIWR